MNQLKNDLSQYLKQLFKSDVLWEMRGHKLLMIENLNLEYSFKTTCYDTLSINLSIPKQVSKSFKNHSLGANVQW